MLVRAAELGDVHETQVLDRYDDGARRGARLDRPDVQDPESVVTAERFHFADKVESVCGVLTGTARPLAPDSTGTRRNESIRTIGKVL
jgi:hypothetical protein